MRNYKFKNPQPVDPVPDEAAPDKEAASETPALQAKPGKKKAPGGSQGTGVVRPHQGPVPKSKQSRDHRGGSG